MDKNPLHIPIFIPYYYNQNALFLCNFFSKRHELFYVFLHKP